MTSHLVGSSKNMTGGLLTSSRAMASRLHWPPDRQLVRVWAHSWRPKAVRISSTWDMDQNREFLCFRGMSWHWLMQQGLIQYTILSWEACFVYSVRIYGTFTGHLVSPLERYALCQCLIHLASLLRCTMQSVELESFCVHRGGGQITKDGASQR